MDVVLIETEGRAREAVIEVDGHRLRVEDGFSRVGEPQPPGGFEMPVFSAIVASPESWDRAVTDNPDCARRLEARWGWRYRGLAEIVGIDPLRIDLGELLLEVELSVDAPGRVGAFIAIDIDRITLSRGSP
jgi:hypothetical protein